MSPKRLQIDFTGKTNYSRYNFTDIKMPYDGFDAWYEAKISYWIDSIHSISPYLAVIPVTTSATEFWWQKYVQFGFGVQWYPFAKMQLFPFGHLRNIRLFMLLAHRDYREKPHYAGEPVDDFHYGGDLYHDNLFDQRLFAGSWWFNCSFRRTNFCSEEYEALLFTGNVKIGLKFRFGPSTLFPHFVADWTYVPRYRTRWWENFVRLGAGVHLYPLRHKTFIFPETVMKRLHLFATYLHNAAWLMNDPDPGSVKVFDIRVGIGLSTGGYFRE